MKVTILIDYTQPDGFNVRVLEGKAETENGRGTVLHEGQTLRTARLVRGLEQSAIARRFHVSQATVSNWERGNKRMPEDVWQWTMEAAADHE